MDFSQVAEQYLLKGLYEMLSPFSLNHRPGLNVAASSPQISGMRDMTQLCQETKSPLYSLSCREQ